MTSSWKFVASLFTLSMFNAMNFTMVYAFLPQLVKSFGMSDRDAGFNVGVIGGIMFIGRGLSSFAWGYLADKKGHKKILLISCSFVTASTLAFGFTNSFEWAVITRLLQGLSMGLVGICKALLAMHCDESNMSFSMAIYVSSFSFGLIIGPAIGGFLSFPHHSYPNVFPKDSLFSKYQILLPIILLVIGYVISMVAVFLFVPSDQKRVPRNNSTKYKSIGNNDDDDDDDDVIEEDKSFDKKYKETLFDEYLVLYTDNESIEFNETRMDENIIRNVNVQKTESNNSLDSDPCYSGTSSSETTYSEKLEIKPIVKREEKIFGLLLLLRKRKCWSVCLLSFVYAFVHIGYEEIFPLFASTSTTLDGLSFSPSRLGMVLLIVASICLPFQFLVLPKVVKRLGCWKVFIGAAIMLTILFPWLPVTKYFLSKQVLFWISLFVILTLLRLSTFCAQLTISLLVNNCVEKKYIGTVNGLAITFSTVGRSIGPPVFGSLFAMSLRLIGEQNGSDGLVFIVFILLSGISLIMAIFVYKCFDRRESRN